MQASTDITERTYIIILNWNGWSDTIECLESVFRIDYPNYRVLVCDNASEDGSVERIKDWAEGRWEVEPSDSQSLIRLISPPVPKPIRLIEYDRSTAEIGGDGDDAPLTLIHTGGNLGYAGGNNVALKYALARHDFGYIWLLNNDTVVEPDALRLMVERLKNRQDAGICGSTLLYYSEPELVEAQGGGRYNKWLGMCKYVGARRHSSRLLDPEQAERCTDYVAGASMLISRPFLRDIGLMSERYFLYFEELDWALRAGKRYGLTYSVDSRVYHKQGQSTGASDLRVDEKSASADRLQLRNRLVLTHKFFPFALPTVCFGLVLAMINRVRRGQWDRVAMILRLWRCDG